MVSLALLLGVVGQMLSIRTGFPSIVFFLVFGILAGPEFFSLVNPEEFGEGLEVIVKLCVAIVLFEAGLNLNKEEAMSHGSIILRLITVGMFITMVGGALLAYYLIDFPLDLAFLYGSLVIVTGPTVIQPLMRKIKVRTNLKNILEYEGVLIDPLGALVAIFVLEMILLEANFVLVDKDLLGQFDYILGVAKGLVYIAWKFILGGFLGILGGYAAALAVKRFYIYMEGFVDLSMLAIALVIYGVSEFLSTDAGLVAAVISGAIVGNINIPEEEEMKKFKGKLTLLVISLLFVFLAASLELEYITDLGLSGVLVVLGLLFVVRPVEIFLLSADSGLSFREKLFLSFISPRGVIAASIASIISLSLYEKNIEGGQTIQGLVFLTISVSVLLQGATAGFMARMLGVNDTNSKVVIVGANDFARFVAKLLKRVGKEVRLIDTNRDLVEASKEEGINAVVGNSLSAEHLEKTEISSSDTLLSLTTSDHVNILCCRLARIDFKTHTTCAVINKMSDTSKIEEMRRFRVPLAFGKKIDMIKLYGKILDKQYVVFRYPVTKEQASERNFDATLPENLIPIIVERGRAGDIEIYRKGLQLDPGDFITMFDMNPVAGLDTTSSVLSGAEKELIEI